MLRFCAVVALCLVSGAAAFAPRRGALPRARARAAAVAPAPPTMICPLAPLAPLWLAGKAVIEGRRKFFPDSEPWPRAWEESDVWLENSISIGPKKSSRVAGDTAKCPIPVEERTAGTRPAASQ